MQEKNTCERKTLLKGKDKLPGIFFDVIPQNIIIKRDGSAEVIDSEWKLSSEIEIGMCVFRSLLLMLSNVSRIGRHADDHQYSRIDFVKEVFVSIGFTDVGESDINRYVSLEAIIQEQITGRPRESFLQWSPDEILHSENLVGQLFRTSREKEKLA